MNIETVLYCGIGVAGAILLLFGFYRISSGKWTNKSVWYELDNAAGATLLIIYQVEYHAYVSAVLNAVWAGIAIIGLLTFLRRYRMLHYKGARKTKRRSS